MCENEARLYCVTDEKLEKRIKKGVPPYSNLVNLKSNTMKNTTQNYKLYINLQE